jgi:hypothetical protein
MPSLAEVAGAAALRFLRDGWERVVPYSADPAEYRANHQAIHRTFVEAALRKAGIDPARAEEEIDDAIDWAYGLEAAATSVAFNGGGDSEELSAARAYYQVLPPAPTARRPCDPPCSHHGRSHRAEANGRRRGPRECGSRSPSGPDKAGPEVRG